MNTYLLRVTDYFLHFLFPVLCFFACESYPKDMHNTLEKAKQTQLRIGAMHAPPWVIIEGNMVTGIEAEIVKGFAQKYSIENYLGATKGTLTEKLCFNNMGFLALFI